MMNPVVLAQRAAVLALIALQLSCGDDDPVSSRVATTIEANSPAALSGSTGADVLAAERPSVIVLDQNGAPLAGVEVTFAVQSGGGSLTGPTSETNALGVATVGSWTLGPMPGTNTLTASAGTATPIITFTANSTNPCASTTAHTIGTTSNGQLTTLDCRLDSDFTDGTYVDRYSTTVSTAGRFTFNQSGSFDTALLLTAPDGSFLAGNVEVTTAATSSVVSVLLPVGSFILGATSANPNVTGSYALTSAAVAAGITNCDQVWATRGITTTQSLQATDCANGGYFSDDLTLFLRAGQSITITMTSTAFDTFLELYSNGTRIAFNDDITPGNQNSRVLYTAGADTFLSIVPTSGAAGATGAYTLTVQ